VSKGPKIRRKLKTAAKNSGDEISTSDTPSQHPQSLYALLLKDEGRCTQSVRPFVQDIFIDRAVKAVWSEADGIYLLHSSLVIEDNNDEMNNSGMI
jgi:hypothetical protein